MPHEIEARHQNMKNYSTKIMNLYWNKWFSTQIIFGGLDQEITNLLCDTFCLILFAILLRDFRLILDDLRLTTPKLPQNNDNVCEKCMPYNNEVGAAVDKNIYKCHTESKFSQSILHEDENVDQDLECCIIRRQELLTLNNNTEINVKSNRIIFSLNCMKEGHFNQLPGKLKEENKCLISENKFLKLKSKRKTISNLQKLIYQPYECRQIKTRYIIFQEEEKIESQYIQHKVFLGCSLLFGLGHLSNDSIEHLCAADQHDQEKESSNFWGGERQIEFIDFEDPKYDPLGDIQMKQTFEFVGVTQNTGEVEWSCDEPRVSKSILDSNKYDKNVAKLSQNTHAESRETQQDKEPAADLENIAFCALPVHQKNEKLFFSQLEKIKEVHDMQECVTSVNSMMDDTIRSSNTDNSNSKRSSGLLSIERNYKDQKKQGGSSSQSSMVKPQIETNREELESQNQSFTSDGEIVSTKRTLEPQFVREEGRGMGAIADLAPVLVETLNTDVKSDLKRDLLKPTTKKMIDVFRRQHTQTLPTFRDRGVSVKFMRFELFRLCSFIREREVTERFQHFTWLANCGFYSVCGTGIVRCYFCGREHQNMLSDDAHDSKCEWKQNNIDLSSSLNSFSNAELQDYFKHYGIGLTTKITGNRASNFENDLDSSSLAIAELSDGEEGVEDDCASDPIPSVSIPHSVSEFLNSSSPDYLFGNRRRSLPDNLNELSGAMVTAETLQPTEEAMVVLTSASKKPFSRPTVGGISSAEGFDLTKAAYPQYSSSYSRSQTYGAWSRDHPKRPEHLSKAGFFYAGYGDCVRCFYCGLGLKFWKPEDIPEYQHARFRPNCVYNCMFMGQEYVNRVQEDQGRGPTASNDLPRQQPSLQTNGNQQGQQISESAQATAAVTVTNTQTAQQATGGEISPHLTGALARSAMDNGYSREQVNEALIYITTNLGEANLSSDALSGYLAGLSPARSRNDSGVETSSSCFSTDRAESMSSSEAEAGHQSSLTQADLGATSLVYIEPLKPEDSIHVRQQLAEVENSMLKQRVSCHVCLAKPIECVYMPCGHVVACKSCAEAANNCVTCGRVIVATANIYMS